MAVELTSIEEVVDLKCGCPQVVDTVSAVNLHPGCDGDITDIEDIVGALNYHQPLGKHICELQQAAKLFNNDLFLVSQLSSSSPNSWVSKKSTYAALKTQLLNDLMGAFKLGTMAYESKNAYSLTSHNHNGSYNKITWTPNSEYQTTNIEKVSCLGIIRISTETLTATDVSSNPQDASIEVSELSINCPKFEVPFPPVPLVGTLKFISAKTIQKLIDTNSLVLKDDGLNVNPYDASNNIRDDFDGWIFPNGTTEFDNINDQLSSAARVFANDSHAAKFTVPALSNFFQSCGDIEGYSIADIPETLGLAKHSHATDPLQMSCNLEIDYDKTRLSTTQACGGSTYIHNGDSSVNGAIKKEHTFDAKLTLDGATLQGLTTTPSGNSSNSTWRPTHNILPVMIYIGGVKRKYYENL